VRDSKFLQSNAYRLAVICILVLMVTLCPFFSVSAGEVKTEYEFIIRGTPVPVRALDNRIGVGGPGGINVKPLMMVDDGIRRYFLPKPPAARVSLEAELSQFETFKIPQQVKRTNLQLNNIGIVKELQSLLCAMGGGQPGRVEVCRVDHFHSCSCAPTNHRQQHRSQ